MSVVVLKLKSFFSFDLAFKLRLFYFFACGVGGVTYFLSVWLNKRNVSFEHVGIIMSMTALSKVFFGSVAASLSDRGFNSKYISIFLSIIAGVGALMLIPETNSLVYMVGVFITTGGFSSNYLICENMTVSAIKVGAIKQNYAQIRVIGTISYAFIAVFTGYVIKKFLDINDTYIIYEVIICCVALMVISAMVTDVRDLNFIKQNRAKFSTLFKQKDFNIVILIVILFNMAYGMQTGFGPLYWESIGIDTMLIGYFVIPMIISETILFLNVKKFFSEVPYQTFFLISTSTLIVRWWLLAFATSPPIIMCALFLHGLNYGCSHLGMMNYIRDVIPENLSARAQAMYSILAGGVFSGLSIMAYGYVYEGLRGKCFLISAFISFIALVLSMHLKGIRFRRKNKIKQA